MNLIDLAESRWLPDTAVRFGIRQLLHKRLRDESAERPEDQSIRYGQLLDSLRHSALAIETDAANEQHYEVPAAFFEQVLGRHLKYSACYWPEGVEDLDSAEADMLALYGERAALADGQDILELGCGWGSLSLWMARNFPGSRITAVSNSHGQRRFIEQRAREAGVSNITVHTCDVNSFSIDERFDRVVSIEMFEHVRNYDLLMQRIAGWLRPEGKLFVHIFCHRYLSYPFEVEGDDNWMGRYFFTGGLMPAADTLLHFQQRMDLERQWCLSGRHYQKTAEAWLNNLDRNRRQAVEILEKTYGKDEAERWLQRWRMFFMACAELFGYRQGNEWLVAHYLFSPRKA